MDLQWRPHFPGCDSLAYLVLGTDELARVAKRVDGRGWVSEVGRHRRDFRRRPFVIAPSRAAAIRWAEAWTRANLERIRDELPRAVQAFGCAKMVWPPTNPELVFVRQTEAVPSLQVGSSLPSE